MKICPNCNREIPDTAVKCKYCKGRAVGNTRIERSLFPIQKIAVFLVVVSIIIGTGLILIKGSPKTTSYINRTHNVKISYPKDWKVFNVNNYYSIFKSLRESVRPEGSNIQLVCAFSCTKNFKSLDPLIIVTAQSVSDDFAGLSSKDLQQILVQNIGEDSNITGHPIVTKIGDRDFVRYVSTSRKWGVEWEHIYYHFVRDKKLYVINLSAKADTTGKYKPVLRSMLENFKVL